MPPDPRPLVYCETNWVVALAFPHHHHHERGRELHQRAGRGECDLRLPYAALLEARHPTTEESNRLSTAFAVVSDALSNAALDILDERYARGEMEKPEFEEKKRSLGK